MPDQPADPVHYDMKIPPEPKPDESREPEKKHGDKINIDRESGQPDAQQEDKLEDRKHSA
jgi:hypothetical protein